MENRTHRETWEAYTATWSETDSAKRNEGLKQNLCEECVYTDPHIQTVGYENLSIYMKQFQQNFTGAKFVITDFIAHHNQSLTHWNMVSCESTIIGKGASFGEYASDGRLKRMTGFFDAD